MTFYYDNDEVTMSKSDLAQLVSERDNLATALRNLMQAADNIGHCEGGLDGKNELDDASIVADKILKELNL